MQLYKVETNEETFFTDANSVALRRWQLEYAKKKRAEGIPFNQIKCVYTPVKFVPHQAMRTLT